MMRLTALIVFLGLAAPSGAQEPHRFLSTQGTLTETELASVDGGAVVVKVLPASVKNELAILGTARIRATREFFLRMYRDIERFETGWGVYFHTGLELYALIKDREHPDDGFCHYPIPSRRRARVSTSTAR